MDTDEHWLSDNLTRISQTFTKIFYGSRLEGFHEFNLHSFLVEVFQFCLGHLRVPLLDGLVAGR